MSVNLIVGIACFVVALGLAAALLVRFLLELIQWSYAEGWNGGKAAAEQSFIEAGRQVDEVRKQMWRDEARQ